MCSWKMRPGSWGTCPITVSENMVALFMDGRDVAERKCLLCTFKLLDRSNTHRKSTGSHALKSRARSDVTSSRSHDATMTQACVIRSGNGRTWALDDQLCVVYDACLRHRLRCHALRPRL